MVMSVGESMRIVWGGASGSEGARKDCALSFTPRHRVSPAVGGMGAAPREALQLQQVRMLTSRIGTTMSKRATAAGKIKCVTLNYGSCWTLDHGCSRNRKAP